MLQHSGVDEIFRALADPTRRAIVERLAIGAMSVSDLAAPFEVSLAAIGQHVQVLETSGLVRTSKVGRVRTVELRPERLALAERWFNDHRRQWERKFDRLGAIFDEPDDEALGAVPPRVDAEVRPLFETLPSPAMPDMTPLPRRLPRLAVPTELTPGGSASKRPVGARTNKSKREASSKKAPPKKATRKKSPRRKP